jgi:hypothetical protein
MLSFLMYASLYLIIGLILMGIYIGRVESGSRRLSLGDYLVSSMIWPLAVVVITGDWIDANRDVAPFFRKIFGKRGAQ